MRTAAIERQTESGEIIKLSLELDINRKIEDFDELETICKTIKNMYDNALKSLFTNDSEDIVKAMIGMED